jgi:hypothetical protein
MAVTITERMQSRVLKTGRDPELVLSYIAEGSSDEQVIKDALYLATLTTRNNLIRSSISIDPEFVDSNNDGGLWNCEVSYRNSARSRVKRSGTVDLSFDTSGGTVHITQSIQNIANVGRPGEIPPDYQGAIGVTDDNVEGTDIPARAFNFKETWYKKATDVTEVYKAKLFNATAKVNNATFRGFAAGQVLLQYVTGTASAVDEDLVDGWSLEFHFSASPNQTSVNIASLNAFNKLGWDYIWFRYPSEQDNTANSTVRRPKSAHIERVLDFADFSSLEIGTNPLGA